MAYLFKVAFYLRSNCKNRQGKKSIMIRISYGAERINLGSTGCFIKESRWDSTIGRGIGRTADIFETNNHLNNIETDLKAIFRRIEFSRDFCLDKVKSEYFGQVEVNDYFFEYFDMVIEERKKEVGKTRSMSSLQKYLIVRRRFAEFLKNKYKRSNIRFSELRSKIIDDFAHYLSAMPNYNINTRWLN